MSSAVSSSSQSSQSSQRRTNKRKHQASDSHEELHQQWLNERAVKANRVEANFIARVEELASASSSKVKATRVETESLKHRFWQTLFDEALAAPYQGFEDGLIGEKSRRFSVQLIMEQGAVFRLRHAHDTLGSNIFTVDKKFLQRGWKEYSQQHPTWRSQIEEWIEETDVPCALEVLQSWGL